MINTFSSASGTPVDYTPLTIPVAIPLYRPNNVLNFRGGNAMDTVLTFQVQVNADNVEEPPEVFFVDVTATRTAIISTPRVPITICGSTCFFHTCNISHLCNLFCVRICIPIVSRLLHGKFQTVDFSLSWWLSRAG